MARAAVAAALFLFLTVAFANPSDIPPVDQDGSGDDDDSFSGSGIEPSLEEEFTLGDNSNKPTEASLTTLPNLPTEKRLVVQEPEWPEEKEPATASTTAVETVKLIPEPEDDVPAEENITNKGSEVLFVPTILPTVQPEIVKTDVAHDVFPVVHNIPQDQTTESVKHTTDPVVDPSHQDGASTTETMEPHKPHHHHHHHPHHHHNRTTVASVTESAETDLHQHHDPHRHHDYHDRTTKSVTEAAETDLHHDDHHHPPHHHHHNRTTAASVTEAAETGLHHVPHHGTSAPSVTHGLAPRLHPAIQEDAGLASTVDPHVHHLQDVDQVTESNVSAHPSTEDANQDSGDTTTNRASYDHEGKTIVPVVFEPESEAEHTESPEFDGSGLDANDFVFEPSIPRAQAPDNKIAVEDDGVSDTSKGILEQKGVLAAVIAGGVAGLVFAICLVGFMLYRMKKKDEGSYCLEETKQTNGGYEKPIKQEEFYA